VLKDTIMKIGCCLFLVVMVVAIGFTLVFLGNDMQPIDIKGTVVSTLSKVYPRFAELGTGSSDL
jgi:hypothetical protein